MRMEIEIGGPSKTYLKREEIIKIKRIKIYD